MNVILIHGMGRSPLSFLLLAARLRHAGFKSYCFAYFVSVESWENCQRRLEKMLIKYSCAQEYMIIAHSLGTVLSRAILPRLIQQPKACFFLAPPTQPSLVAQKLAPFTVYRLLTGEMGQLLADHTFMASLPMPAVPTKIYAGTNGFYGKYSPFKNEPNDGVLMVKETGLPDIPRQILPVTHTFMMMDQQVTNDILRIATSASILSACSE